jgi:hypothetical protein
MDLTRQRESLIRLLRMAFKKKPESNVDNLQGKKNYNNVYITINSIPVNIMVPFKR